MRKIKQNKICNKSYRSCPDSFSSWSTWNCFMFEDDEDVVSLKALPRIWSNFMLGAVYTLYISTCIPPIVYCSHSLKSRRLRYKSAVLTKLNLDFCCDNTSIFLSIPHFPFGSAASAYSRTRTCFRFCVRPQKWRCTTTSVQNKLYLLSSLGVVVFVE